MEEPDGTSHAVLLGGLGSAQGCQGPPANGLARPAAGPLPAPLLRRLASAPPSGRDEQGYSPDETECQEQSENITHPPVIPSRHGRTRPEDPARLPGQASARARNPSPLRLQDRTYRCSLGLGTSGDGFRVRAAGAPRN